MKKGVILLLAVMMLAGCGIISPSSTPEVDSETIYTVGGKKKSDESAVSLRSDGKTVVSFHAQIDNTGALRTIVNKFNSASTYIYLHFNELNIEKNDMYTQFRMALEAADEAYDLMLIDIAWNADFASRGLIADLSGYIDARGLDLSAYLSNAVTASKYQEGIYSMPIEAGISMLYYRKDLMDTAPVTWDLLTLLCESAMDDYLCKNSLAFGGKISYESMFLILDLVNIYGGRFLDESGYPALDLPRLAMALQKYKEMYSSDYVPSSMYYMSGANASDTFISGDSMMLVSGSQTWKRANGKGSMVVGNFALAPIPKTDSYIDRSQLLAGTSAAIAAASPNQDAAWEVIEYLTGEASQKILTVSGGFSPSLLKMYDDPDALMTNVFFSSNNYRNSLFNATPQPITPNYFSFISVLQEQLGEYLSGRVDIDSTLEKIEQELGRVMGAPK